MKTLTAIDQIIDSNAAEIYAAALRINSLPGLCDWASALFDGMPESEYDNAGGYDAVYSALCGFYRHNHIVDIDERGEYRCHVENCNGLTVWQAGTDDAGEFWPTADGFMRHTSDMSGLAEYLAEMRIIPAGSTIENLN